MDESGIVQLRWVRLLRRMTLVLMLMMIAGTGVIIWLIFGIYQETSRAPVLPAHIQLPKGEQILAITQGHSWNGVVTAGPNGERLHVIDPKTGAIRRSIEIGHDAE